MVGVAQLVEHLVVVQVVAGSSPVTHPKQMRPGVDPPGLICLLDRGCRDSGGGRRKTADGPVTHPKVIGPGVDPPGPITLGRMGRDSGGNRREAIDGSRHSPHIEKVRG